MPSAAVCLDVGSTWTKAVLVRPDGALAGFAEHPTTVADVLAGVDAAVRAVVAAAPNAPDPQLLACSSAGGGLRLAVVGTDRLIAEEAGHRVARSAGSRVVHVHAGPLDPGDVRVLRGSRPGVVLLTGGADGDDPAPLLHNAARLARARVRFPIVLAGNEAARDDALALLAATGRTVVACANVTPRPGELQPGPARAAVAELYAHHVLGGRGPASHTGSAAWSGLAGTRWGAARPCSPRCSASACWSSTSATRPRRAPRRPRHAGRAADPGPGRERAGLLPHLGGRPGHALGRCGRARRGPGRGDRRPGRGRPARSDSPERMTTEVGYVPRDAGSAAEDRRIAALAAVLAVRRHRVAHEARGQVLADIGLLVLTGGVFRRPDANGLAAVVATVRNDVVLAPLLAKARVAVDGDFAVTPAGLLTAAGRTDAARALLHDHLLG